MSRLARIALALLLATVQVPAAFALDNAPATLSQELMPFSSDEGLARLARSSAKVDFPALANQFEAESNGAFCGPASAAIVLNAVRGRSPDLPRDRSRLHPEDLKYIPSARSHDPSLHTGQCDHQRPEDPRASSRRTGDDQWKTDSGLRLSGPSAR